MGRKKRGIEKTKKRAGTSVKDIVETQMKIVEAVYRWKSLPVCTDRSQKLSGVDRYDGDVSRAAMVVDLEVWF